MIHTLHRVLTTRLTKRYCRDLLLNRCNCHIMELMSARDTKARIAATTNYSNQKTQLGCPLGGEWNANRQTVKH